MAKELFKPLGMDRAVTRPPDERTEVVAETLQDEQIMGTSHRPLAEYCGRYFNRIREWVMDIKLVDDKLCLEFLGREDERYALRHHHHDIFVRNLSYDDTVKRGQYIRDYMYYKIEFEMSGETGDLITTVRWRHDGAVPGGKCFTKQLVRRD
jgi:hypothetical protein